MYADSDSVEIDSDDYYAARPNAEAEKHLRSPITASLLERALDLYNTVLTSTPNTVNPYTGKQSTVPHIPRTIDQHINRVVNQHPRFEYSGLKKICRPFLSDLILSSRPPSIVTPRQYPDFFSRTIVSKKALSDSLSEATELYHAEMNAFKRWGTVPEIETLISHELEFSPTLGLETYDHYERYRYWDYIVERYRNNKRSKKFGFSGIKHNDIRFYFYDGFIMEQHGVPEIRDGKKKTPLRYIYSYEQAQMFQDSCLSRFNALMAIDSNMHNADAEIKSQFVRLLAWQESVLVKHDNLGYELVKYPEAIGKAYLNTLTKGDVMYKSSLDRTLDKMREKEIKIGGDGALTTSLLEIFESTNCLSNVAELFGCIKLSGHPFVYAAKSAESVRNEALPVGRLDLVTLRDYHNTFKRLVLERYLYIHKDWPPFDSKSLPSPESKLHELWKKKVLFLTPGSFPLADLTNVEFGKFMEFDYSPDYLDMIDDKAINPGAKYAAGFWYSQPSGSYRRLLEALIKRVDIDMFAIVERMRTGRFTPEERIVELTQKEREFKTSARCFCKLTFEVRLFFVLTEANLKRFMGGSSGDNGYMPQQTMTMSSTKLKRRLYDLTINEKRKNTCIVEVDFSRWNLRWRAASVNPISRTLEKIFGLRGVFSQAHYFFESSTFVMTDKHTLPKGVKQGVPAYLWPESDLVWRGHRGGVEGIQQTLWTICTIAMMYFALRREECSFQMAGQGDNQVFHLMFNLRQDETLSYALMKLLNALERECAKLNHEVKPEECVDSSTVLTYGKEIYAEGVHIQYSLKFSSRAFARLDHSVPSLTKEIAGIVSNSIAVSGTLKNTYRAIWWKFIQVLLCLRRRMNSPLYASEKSSLARLLRNSNSRKILLIPGSLGGLPMMPWTRYFSRGETDDLSFDCAATYYLSQVEPLVKNYMSLLCRGEFTTRSIDTTNLINDPHSIPIDRPNDASHLIADIVGTRLPSLVLNRDLSPLVQPNLRRMGEQYKKLLIKMKPLYPQIASDLFDLTPAGLYNKTVKRFSMTKTIEKLVPGIAIESRVSDANQLLINTLIDRFILASKTRGSLHKKPYETAQCLRSMWGIGLRNSSVGVYTPFDFQLDNFSFRKKVISASVHPTAKILSTKGSSPPNFGTSTIAKLSDHGYRIVNCNSTMRDIKKAVLIHSELQADNTIRPLIDSIVTARSPWRTDQLTRIFPTQYGGTSVHRHAASRNKFSVLGSCSVPTHITFSSDRAGILSGGEQDYPVVFQTLFLTLTNLYQNIASHSIVPPSTLAYIIPDQLDPIDTSPAQYESTAPIIPSWPNLRGNKLAWVEDMFATEVPTVPDPTLIPHTLNPNTLDLVYSYLERKIVPSAESKRVWDGILATSDFFDFKEISRVDPYIVEEALAWVVLTDTFFDTISREQSEEKRSITSELKRKALYYAGGWIRIRIHPDFIGTDYNLRRMIALGPTEVGYKKPVEYMATKIIRRIHHIINTRGDSRIPTLLLFNDWTDYTAHVARRRLTLAHILATQTRISVAELQREVVLNSPPIELLKRDPTVYIFTSSKTISRRVAGFNYTLPEMRNMYINLSAEESFRLMRDREKADIYSRIGKPSDISYSNHGIVKYSVSSLSGICTPDIERLNIPIADRFRVLKRRTIGKSSPLYSDWNAVLQHILKTSGLNISEAHLFGVGRGATARFFCENKIRCIGYDLRSTFPTISHRDTSYIPPEVVLSCDTSYFLWSDHTFRTDGNILTGTLDIDEAEYPLAVIDIDQSLTTVVDLLRRLPLSSKVITRYRGTESSIKYLISVLRPDKVYCLAQTNGSIYDAVLVMRELVPVGDGNFMNINLLPFSEISYRNLDNESVFQLLDVAPLLCRHLEIDTDSSLVDARLKLSKFANSRADSNPSEIQPYHVLAKSIDLVQNPSGRDLRIAAIFSNIFDTVV
ncbi:MAG: putative RNA-dependent RNA polymerase [Trichoderma harzianum negative-stranded virus 2]|nr:MAG: putative RNA-dependent RNA polymerase [Trichoderma harzianum negative-stranded virus 2]